MEHGYKNVNGKCRKKLINAIVTYFSFYGGYCKVVGDYETFRKWMKKYRDAKLNSGLQSVFENKKNKQQYCIYTIL
jgi:hypothetical protein